MIFVFGSNEAGNHAGGAARYALSLGAEMGVAFGMRGDTFAVPTLDKEFQQLSLAQIETYVNQFLHFAEVNPELTFQVTCLGCGIAGFKHSDIAPMFQGASENCLFDNQWQPYLGNAAKYWGTF